MRSATTMFGVCLLACGAPPEQSEPTGLPLRIEYRAATELDPNGLEDRMDCVMAVGKTHVHPSWQKYRIVYMNAEESGLWAFDFADVQPGALRLRISDGNVCRDNATGAVTKRAIRANGVLLTKAAETPGDEGFPEPGFAFLLNEDGSVSP